LFEFPACVTGKRGIFLIPPAHPGIWDHRKRNGGGSAQRALLELWVRAVRDSYYGEERTIIMERSLEDRP
jgi:hypothetical protein